MGKEPHTRLDVAMETTLRGLGCLKFVEDAWLKLELEGAVARYDRSQAGRRYTRRHVRFGVREGWKAVTIRAVARMLGYTAPLLYEHFHDKREILTQRAIEGQLSL